MIRNSRIIPFLQAILGQCEPNKKDCLNGSMSGTNPTRTLALKA